ncbi:histidine ammonia-lyase [Aliidongia dinghuensis]|uniref:Histidine ammonia-lyase n=1 Tax=Aliidongia dinghuensis TaxID=1867774 RepID=A0A8J2YYV5_9PROT|nr:aromatic amino acid lyase [Aliidongia dinghuensis]GGF42500.1 histidine ammonia-lyase [Aliidongia dinghuensis]
MGRTIKLGTEHLSAQDVAEIARGDAAMALGVEARAAIAASHAALDRLAGSGMAIYGVSTGLGAAADTRVSPGDAVIQQRIPLARSVGVGRHARRDEVRAIMAVRLARLAVGRSGASLGTVEALVRMLEHRVHPVVPMTGSVGEADLAPLAHIASVLIGYGEAELDGTLLSGAEALRRAGLTPPALGAKDGLALVSSNAASVGVGALAVVDARRALGGLLAAAALSFEGYRANLSPLWPNAVALRPVPGLAAVAEAMLGACAGGDLARPNGVRSNGARRLQDPLSFRCLGQVHGAAVSALAAALDAIELELNSSDDNPAILADDALSLPNANFDATHLALAFEGLGQALARVAAAAGERIMKLMSPAASELPRFLAPVQDGRNGFATVQKTVSALVAEIQHKALPMPVALLPVADRVEDYGTMALGIVEKTAEIVERVRLLAAIELMVAAQACDLRGGVTLGQGTRTVHAAVRAVVAPLGDDRQLSPDIAALDGLVASGAFDVPFALPAGRP